MMHFPHGLRGFVSALASRFAEAPQPRRDGPVEPLLNEQCKPDRLSNDRPTGEREKQSW